jgi:hypothetical protein
VEQPDPERDGAAFQDQAGEGDVGVVKRYRVPSTAYRVRDVR